MDWLQTFQNPPKSARPIAWWELGKSLPLEEVTHQVRTMAESGFGGVILSPGSRLNYLTPAWMAMVQSVVREADRHELRLWLYDQFGGASDTHSLPPDARLRLLVLRDQVDFAEDGAREYILPGDCEIYAILTASVNGDLHTFSILDAVDGRLTLPDNAQKLYAFCLIDARLKHRDYLFDYLNPAMTVERMESLYQVYRDYLAVDVGKIERIILDIPMPLDFSEEGIPWSDSLVHRFQQHYHYEIINTLPSLFSDGPGTNPEHRCRFYQCMVDQINESYLKSVMEVTPPAEERPLFPSNLFILSWMGMKYGDPKSSDEFYSQPEKLITSSIHWWGNRYALSRYALSDGERPVFSALDTASQELGEEELGDLVLGQNLLTVRWSPESIANPVLKNYTDFVAHASALMQVGEPNIPIVTLFPVRTYWSSYSYLKSNDPGQEEFIDRVNNVADIQFQSSYDFDWLPEELLPHLNVDENGQFIFHLNETRVRRFSIMLLPCCRTLLERSLDEIERLGKAGGKILFVYELTNATVEHGIRDAIRDRVQGFVDTTPNVFYAEDDWLEIVGQHVPQPLEWMDSGGRTIEVHQRVISSGTVSIIRYGALDPNPISVRLSESHRIYEADLIQSVIRGPLSDDSSFTLDLTSNSSKILLHFNTPIQEAKRMEKIDSVATIPFPDQFFFFPLKNNRFNLNDWNCNIKQDSLTTHFWVREYRPPLWLNIENLSLFDRESLAADIRLNGEEVPFNFHSEYPHLLKLNPYVWKGQNELSIFNRTGQSGELYLKGPLVLEGDFSIEAIDDQNVITLPKNSVNLAEWEGQDYPDYTGTCIYRQKLDIPGEYKHKGFLVSFSLQTHLLEILVNQKKIGLLYHSPWQIDVTEAIQPGENVFEFRVTPVVNQHSESPKVGRLGPVTLEVYNRVF